MVYPGCQRYTIKGGQTRLTRGDPIKKLIAPIDVIIQFPFFGGTIPRIGKIL